MNGTPYRAWWFGLAPMIGGGRLPIGRGFVLTPRGSIAMVEGDDAIRQAILLLLSTVPGERVMRPDYGCYIHRLIFSPNDDTTAGLAMHYVRRAVTRWEPRVDILSVDARRNDRQPERLDVLLEYRVRATRRVETLVASVDLTGGAA